MNTEHQDVHCFSCKRAVHNDNRRRDIKKIRDTLNQVQLLDADYEGAERKQDSSEPSAASPAQARWKRVKNVLVLPFLAASAVLERKNEDKMRTAMARWQHQLLVKCFHSWREYRHSEDAEEAADEQFDSASSVGPGRKRAAKAHLHALIALYFQFSQTLHLITGHHRAAGACRQDCCSRAACFRRV